MVSTDMVTPTNVNLDENHPSFLPILAFPMSKSLKWSSYSLVDERNPSSERP